MKRSLMLEYLTNLISFNRHVTADKLAEGVLELVERNGMLPPTAHWPAIDDYGPIKELLEAGDVDAKPAWIPEDREV